MAFNGSSIGKCDKKLYLLDLLLESDKVAVIFQALVGDIIPSYTISEQKQCDNPMVQCSYH